MKNSSKGIVLDWFEELKINKLSVKNITLLSSKGGLATTMTTTSIGPCMGYGLVSVGELVRPTVKLSSPNLESEHWD